MGIATLDELKQLSVAERLLLVEDLWDSIEADTPDITPLTAAQEGEVERRLKAHAANPGSAVAWEQVRARLLSRDR